MARLARLYAPQTCHLVQARLLPQTLAQMQELKPRLLQWLEQSASRYQLSVHAWSITDQEIYLLCTPEHERSVSQVMQSLGRNMAAYLQQGAVFAGRFRSCLVQDGEYVLASMIWLEHHIFRAKGLEHPEYLPWSSAAYHVGVHASLLSGIRDHTDYWYLGNTPFERQARYRELYQEGLSSSVITRLENALQGQWVLGHPEFVESIAAVASRRVAPASRGRPKKII